MAGTNEDNDRYEGALCWSHQGKWVSFKDSLPLYSSRDPTIISAYVLAKLPFLSFSFSSLMAHHGPDPHYKCFSSPLLLFPSIHHQSHVSSLSKRWRMLKSLQLGEIGLPLAPFSLCSCSFCAFFPILLFRHHQPPFNLTVFLFRSFIHHQMRCSTCSPEQMSSGDFSPSLEMHCEEK